MPKLFFSPRLFVTEAGVRAAGDVDEPARVVRERVVVDDRGRRAVVQLDRVGRRGRAALRERPRRAGVDAEIVSEREVGQEARVVGMAKLFGSWPLTTRQPSTCRMMFFSMTMSFDQLNSAELLWLLLLTQIALPWSDPAH
jgi:hypothetical protein